LSDSTKTTLQKVSEAVQSELLSDLKDGLNQSHARVEEVSREASAEVSKILETSARQAESLKRQLIGSAELESRNLQLRALEGDVTGVFAEAVRRLSGLSPSKYEEALTRLLEEGVKVMGSKASVSCNAKDKKTVSSVLRKLNKGETKLTLAHDDVETIGGVVLSSNDGTVSFDNTFEARLERMRQDLRKDVAGLLMARAAPAEESAAAARDEPVLV
jgi:V/A-type H+-transporting ATPase subunit E